MLCDISVNCELLVTNCGCEFDYERLEGVPIELNQERFKLGQRQVASDAPMFDLNHASKGYRSPKSTDIGTIRCQ